MANIFKKLISAAAITAITASILPVAFAAPLPEEIIVNQTELSNLNKSFETDTSVSGKQVGDADQISYSPLTIPYVIEFDITVDTPLRVGGTSKNVRDSFGIGFTRTSDWSTRGGFFGVAASTDSTVQFTWMSGDGSTSNNKDFGIYTIGETYKMRFSFESDGVYFKSFDSEGNVYKEVTGVLPTRNSTSTSSMSVITVATNARENGVTDSVTISNATVYNNGPDAIDVQYDGKNLSDTETNTITYDGSSLYPLTTVVSSGGAATTAYTATLALEDAPAGFELTSEGITVADNLETGIYNFSISATLDDYPNETVSFPIAFNVVELDADTIVKLGADSIVLDTAQTNLTDNGDGTYSSTGTVTLPAVKGKANVAWTVEQKAEDGSWVVAQYAKVADGELTYDTKNAPKDYTIKLTAEISYGDKSVLKEFVITAPDLQTIVYYNEDFDSFKAGTITDLSMLDSEKPVVYASQGMTFNSGTRSSGGSTENSIVTVEEETGNKYIQLNLTNYYDAAYYAIPTITFTRNSSVRSNSLVIMADIMFGASSGVLQFNDTSNNTIAISAPTNAGQWYSYEMYIGNNITYVFVYDKTTGAIADYQELDSTIKRLSTINVPNANVGAISIDNFKLIDTKYELNYADIQKVAYDKLKIDTTQQSITFKNGIYSATGDFDIPEVPTGASVTWEAYQKKSGETEWQPSSFITVAGTSATINPTDDASDYEIKLVATITAGSEEPLEKEFIFTLPNPLEEITAVLGSGYEKVSSADAADTKFDLKGADVLKYDLVLPTRVSGYANTTIAWTSSDEEHIAIAADGTATIMTSDLDLHDVTLTAVVTYKKGSVTYSSEPQVFNIKMGYTSGDVDSEDAALGKYKVRFDAAYDDNFKTIPSSTSSSITLPTTGKFGSTFTWNSSVPTVISNLGKYTKPASTKSVVMTATIISGAASQEKPFTIIVSGSSSSSGGGGGGGGSTSSTGTTSSSNSSGSVATSTTTAVAGSTGVNGAEVVEKLLEEAAQANDAFADISSAVWAREAINGLAAAGIINGKSETEFAPNDTVTRAEFAKMLMGTFGLNSASFTSSSFRDVSTDAWYFQAVETAYNLGIITGIDDGVFAPDALITRQDMAVMVSRAAAVTGKDIPETVEAKSFADASSISSYAVNAVDQLVKGGIINGMSDTEFAPLSNATRAQAAKILYSFL
ncbi:MAG: S-layer homology domain-containing protein [Candidatus Ornithomonoglobus sp.]